MAWTVEDDYPKSSTDQRLYESRHVLALTRPAVDEVDDGTVTRKMSTDHTALALDLGRCACRPLSLGFLVEAERKTTDRPPIAPARWE